MTPYKIIFDRFIKKIKNDEDFFNYGDLPEESIQKLIGDHILNLLQQAIEEIYDNCNPDVNFFNKNDESEQFNFELTHVEIALLVNLMYQKYMEEERNKLKVFEATFRSNELNVISPANERKTYINMLNEITIENKRRISNYISRDRETGEFKMLG